MNSRQKDKRGMKDCKVKENNLCNRPCIKDNKEPRDFNWWLANCRTLCINVDDACPDCVNLDLYEGDYSAEVEWVLMQWHRVKVPRK